MSLEVQLKKTFFVRAQDILLKRDYLRKALDKLINIANERHLEVMQSHFQTWFNKRKENKWISITLRNLIRNTTIETQIAVWRMKIYSSNRNKHIRIKEGLFFFAKVCRVMREDLLFQSFLKIEKQRLFDQLNLKNWNSEFQSSKQIDQFPPQDDSYMFSNRDFYEQFDVNLKESVAKLPQLQQ